jgi:hypothetical protein
LTLPVWARGQDGGAVFGELDLIHSRQQGQERFSGLDFNQRRPVEVDTQTRLRERSLEHRLVRMTQRHGPQPHAIFDVLAPFRVPDPTTLALHDDVWCVLRVLIVSLRIGMRPTRNDPVGALAD